MSEQHSLTYTPPRDDVHTEPGAIRFVIVTLAVLFLLIFVVLPLVVVFASAFSKGVMAYVAALGEPDAGLHRHGGPCHFSTGNTRGKRPCAPDRCRQGSAKRAQADPVHHRCARDFLSHDFRRAAAGRGIRLGLF